MFSPGWNTDGENVRAGEKGGGNRDVGGVQRDREAG